MANEYSEVKRTLKSKKEIRQDIQRQIYLGLGGGMIDVELDPEHYELAIDKAFERFRQRSSLALEESYLFLELQPEVTEYYLPSEVREVRQIQRRGVAGTTSGGGTYFDPFAMAYTNMYLLEAGRQGGLATFDFFSQYQETMGRLFGANIDFIWNQTASKLTILRRMLHPEQAALWVFNYRPDAVLWNDDSCRNWLRRWAMAECQLMLGSARSKYPNLGGPNGGVSLYGEGLLTSANAEFEALELEIVNHVASDPGYSIIIG
jgi:hypothetical protein